MKIMIIKNKRTTNKKKDTNDNSIECLLGNDDTEHDNDTSFLMYEGTTSNQEEDNKEDSVNYLLGGGTDNDLFLTHVASVVAP
jgi:hypothetical protein